MPRYAARSRRRASDLTFNKFLAHLPADTREQIFPGLDLSPASRIRPETAAALWERMDAGAKLAQYVEGRPSPSHSDTVVAFASMAMGLHEQTFQSLFNVVHFGMNVKEAVDAPAFFVPRPVGDMNDTDDPPEWVVRVMSGDFDQAVLAASGLPIEQLPAERRRYAQGLWAGISRDPDTGELTAASHPYTNGQALAY